MQATRALTAISPSSPNKQQPMRNSSTNERLQAIFQVAEQIIGPLAETNPMLAMVAPFLTMGGQSLTDNQQTTSFLELCQRMLNIVLDRESSDEAFSDALVGLVQEVMSAATIQHQAV